MFWFRGCPRCHGDLHTEGSVEGVLLRCVQCSHYLTPAEERGFVMRVPPKPALRPHQIATRLAHETLVPLTACPGANQRHAPARGPHERAKQLALPA